MVTAFLDANVLYPAPLSDFLLSLAEEDLFKPLWSDQIDHDENVTQWDDYRCEIPSDR